jgi:Rhodopirellula transposase DDE domain
LFNDAGYNLQGNRKTTEGDSHPDGDAQFAHINTQVAAALAEKQPVISIKDSGRAVPYGVYDLAANFEWVSVAAFGHAL